MCVISEYALRQFIVSVVNLQSRIASRENVDQDLVLRQ